MSITWERLIEDLGEPASEGERPWPSDTWQPIGFSREGQRYATWDCNSLLGTVQDGARALDAIDERIDVPEITMLRGIVALLLSTTCCVAFQEGDPAGGWVMSNVCMRHRV